MSIATGKAMIIALQAQVDATAQGTSGLAKFNEYVAKGRKDKPPKYESIAAALQPFGYTPELFETVPAEFCFGSADSNTGLFFSASNAEVSGTLKPEGSSLRLPGSEKPSVPF